MQSFLLILNLIGTFIKIWIEACLTIKGLAVVHVWIIAITNSTVNIVEVVRTIVLLYCLREWFLSKNFVLKASSF